jgi:hypothetical protein
MLPKETLAILTRKEALTDTDWFDLIEARRAAIKTYLDTFTLPTLGDLHCMRSSNGLHTLTQDFPRQAPEEQRLFWLKTQGLFYTQPHSAIEYKAGTGHQPGLGGVPYPDGVLQIWGLTRSGKWVVATVEFVGEAGYKDRGRQRATALSISECEIQDLLEKTKESPQVVWNSLGDSVKAWAERRQRLANEAQRLAHMIEIEELVMCQLNAE